MISSLTIFFEDPFWVGIFEITDCNQLTAAKVTFGAEPSDKEVFQFILTNYAELVFSSPVSAQKVSPAHKSPKRRLRFATSLLSKKGIGTKSQDALKQQYEQGKQKNKKVARAEREEADRAAFAKRQEKRKKKHCGH